MINIKNSVDCCGCTACVSVCAHNAIVMKSDIEGFSYPLVNNNLCVDCGLCDNVCPIIYRKSTDENKTTLEYYALRIKDKEILKQSSSGGAFSLLCDYVLSRNGFVCGVEYSSRGVVQHTFIDNKDDLKRLRGSKYAQSNLDGIYARLKSHLKEKKWVLFSGTPCQVDGLRRFLRKDYENLITVDLVCHAVPSPLIYKEYLAYCSRKLGEEVVSIDMRDKSTYGWSHKYSYRFHYKNGKRTLDPIKVVNWGKLFFSELINRPSCGECKYANLHRPGDFTIADFWDDYKTRPEIYSKEGTSLLLVNSEKAKSVFAEVKDDCLYWSLRYEEALQPNLIRPTKTHPQRKLFWEYYHANGFDKTYKKYFADSNKEMLKKIIKRLLEYVK